MISYEEFCAFYTLVKIYDVSIKKFYILDVKKLIFCIFNMLFIYFIKYFHMFCIFIIDKYFIYISIYKYKYKIKKNYFLTLVFFLDISLS